MRILTLTKYELELRDTFEYDVFLPALLIVYTYSVSTVPGSFKGLAQDLKVERSTMAHLITKVLMI